MDSRVLVLSKLLLILAVFLIPIYTVGFSADTFVARETLPTSTILHTTAESVVSLNGSSTVGDWSCQSKAIHGYIGIQQTPEKLRSTLNKLESVTTEKQLQSWLRSANLGLPQIYIALPVTEFDCGNDRQNRDMYEALRAKQHPQLHYRFYGLDPRPTLEDFDQNQFQLSTVGGLAIAGAARTKQFTVTLNKTSPLQFTVSGSFPAQMTKFDVTPPRALFGLIKAYDKLTVKFELTVKPFSGNQQQLINKIIPRVKTIRNNVPDPSGKTNP